MKLAILALAGLLSLGSIAHADADGQRQRPQPRTQLRGAVLAQFDHNHDGRLQPQERRQAIRTLRHLTRNLARQQQAARRRIGRERNVIRRFDVDGDGRVGPGEMPRDLADHMRPLDRNRDGWIDDRDQ